jgi:site-specific recombinase XerD
MTRMAARNYFTALEEAGRSPNTIRQAKVVLAAMFTMAVSDIYLDVNPFHDVQTPKVPGPRSIKIATTEQYLQVRARLPTKPARVFSTLLVSSGLRFCEAIALQPVDFDFSSGKSATCAHSRLQGRRQGWIQSSFHFSSRCSMPRNPD